MYHTVRRTRDEGPNLIPCHAIHPAQPGLVVVSLIGPSQAYSVYVMEMADDVADFGTVKTESCVEQGLGGDPSWETYIYGR